MGTAKIFVKYEKNPLQFLLWAAPRLTVIDKKEFRLVPRREVEIPLDSGPNVIQISIPYLGSEAVKTTRTITMEDREERHFVFRSPIFVFCEGVLRVVDSNPSQIVSLNQASARIAEPDAPSDLPTTPAEPGTCFYCGKKIPVDAYFCKHCNRSLPR